MSQYQYRRTASGHPERRKFRGTAWSRPKGAGNEGGIPTTSSPRLSDVRDVDPALISRVGAAQGYEARYITQNEKYKRPVLVVWVPNADLARDPRWGRNEESYGEDPFSPARWRRRSPKGCRATIRNTGKRRHC